MTPEIESKVRFHERVHRAWENSSYYRRDAQHDAEGWEEEVICACGSDLPARECHESGPCHFDCICNEQAGGE